MDNNQNSNQKKFDLEDRTLDFAKRVVRLCRALPKDSVNNRLVGQVTGAAGSVGANYREANDALGKKDFICRLKISRKEAKEALYWLELIEEANVAVKDRMQEIKKECLEIKNILSAIIIKAEKKKGDFEN
ncbi:MAG: four helix bundle protein [Candidatus Moranbacteria bacterium]|nr:four helix bundle protein [Candidatus Moranbacteria bacterium]